MTTYAIVRPVSPSIVECALTYLDRQPIDPDLAARQHDAYVETLRSLGAEIVELPAAPDLPDAVFVEDTAVVVDEIGVITAPRLDARRQEVQSTAATLSDYRALKQIQGEGTLEGGDVLRIGRTLYVGLSHRSNAEGVAQLADYLRPYDYEVIGTPFDGALHLKTACTFIGNRTLLANPSWVDTSRFGDVDVIEVAPGEETAGNALLLNETVVLPANFPATRAILEERGFRVVPVDVTELQKAEAGVTCCSILLNA
jgi:dimethylargininase